MAPLTRIFAPRWFILFTDLFFCFVALLLAFLLRFNFHTGILSDYPVAQIIGLTTAGNVIFFFLFKTYSGIIRYTSFEDAGRIFVVNSLICGSFFIMEQVLTISDMNSTFFPLSVLLIYYLTSNFLLISYRLIIKYIYAHLIHSKKRTVKAVLYDTGPEGLMIQKMIAGNPESDVNILAYMDDREKLVGKVIDHIRVVRADSKTIKKYKRQGVELLVLATPKLPRNRLNELVNLCLENNIRIQQVPPAQQWLNHTFNLDQLKDINIEQLLEREVIHIDNLELGKELQNKKILVTGAAGSIGSEIMRQVLKYAPALVIACDSAETPLHELNLSLPEEAPVKMFIGSVCDRTRMEQLFAVYSPDIVYHAAAYKHVPMMEAHPSEAVRNNVMGAKVMAELAVAHKAAKFVMISTDKAVRPTNVMGASKRIAEIFIQSYAHFITGNDTPGDVRDGSANPTTRFITTRFGNVLGSNGSVIPRFKKQLEAGGPITITHPDITRYFMTIPEACQLVLEAGAMGKGGEIFVFDMGSPVRIVDLAKKMIQLSGKVPYQDIGLVFTGLRPGEKLYEELLNDAENTLPTYHKKILIAKVQQYDFPFVRQQIEGLLDAAGKHMTMETVIQMKKIVPEYKSNNSIFEKMDRQAS